MSIQLTRIMLNLYKLCMFQYYMYELIYTDICLFIYYSMYTLQAYILTYIHMYICMVCTYTYVIQANVFIYIFYLANALFYFITRSSIEKRLALEMSQLLKLKANRAIVLSPHQQPSNTLSQSAVNVRLLFGCHGRKVLKIGLDDSFKY